MVYCALALSLGSAPGAALAVDQIGPADFVTPANPSQALTIDRSRPVVMLASVGSVPKVGDLGGESAAQSEQPKLTSALLAAYVARQQQLKAFDGFGVEPKPELTPELLSAYIEQQQNPALEAIETMTLKPAYRADPEPALNAAVLESYAESKYVPTVRRVKLADDERLCLTQAIYHEARGESVEGQWAVANVIINRAFSKKFPTTICGVVFQNVHKGSHACQFSFACDGKSDMGADRRAWSRAEQIADAAFAEFQTGDRPDVLPGSALYYHTRSVSPNWSHTFQRVAAIGSHLFYAPNG